MKESYQDIYTFPEGQPLLNFAKPEQSGIYRVTLPVIDGGHFNTLGIDPNEMLQAVKEYIAAQ